jgi:hypothetical protein
MTTRTIVTSQPDVACDVCDRRLLRGEQPDVFLAAGRRRTVCELCAPRAVHEGWLRETERQSVSLPALRPRRGRSFFERLRQVGAPRGTPGGRTAGSPAEGAGGEPAVGLPYAREPEAQPAAEPLGAPEPSGAPQPYDFLDGYAGGPAEPLGATPRTRPAAGRVDRDGAGAAAFDGEGPPSPATRPPASELERAIAVFNAGEYPRRIAGVARSLGAPEVSVRSAEHAKSVVWIVVAWELCWYRYEVDLDELDAEARVLAQGTELAELTHEDRLVNVVAGESGALLASGF